MSKGTSTTVMILILLNSVSVRMSYGRPISKSLFSQLMTAVGPSSAVRACELSIILFPLFLVCGTPRGTRRSGRGLPGPARPTKAISCALRSARSGQRAKQGEHVAPDSESSGSLTTYLGSPPSCANSKPITLAFARPKVLAGLGRAQPTMSGACSSVEAVRSTWRIARCATGWSHHEAWLGFRPWSRAEHLH